ncbi:Helix-turn-helix protein, partial [human gut metagenome]
SIVKNTKIDLDSAIKISRVLKTPIEDIFMLKKNSFFQTHQYYQIFLIHSYTYNSLCYK